MARLDIERSTATTVVLGGRELTYFGGCGYLGLAHHPDVVHAARTGFERYGVSSGASRETTGNTRAHDELESALAHHLGCDALALLPDGYLANLAALQSLAGAVDIALVDDGAHPSLFDAAYAARLGVQHFQHASAEAVRCLLGESAERCAVLTDTVFPSRGEIAPIAELAQACEASEAWLVLDDCHGTGVIGATGRGALEHAKLPGKRVLLTSTLSKALGCYGGFVAGSREAIERVRGSAAYVGSTPIPPAIATAASVAVELAFADNRLVTKLRDNLERFHARSRKFRTSAHAAQLPVIAFSLGAPERMRAVEAALLDDGILAPYVCYPGGPPEGNFRIVVTAAHDHADIERLAGALARHLAT